MTRRSAFYFLLLSFVLVGAPKVVLGTLVAYYNFDDAAAPTGGLSGYCPNVATAGYLNESAAVVSAFCRFGGCLDTSNGSMELSGLKIFQSSASHLSVSLWLGVKSYGANPVGSYILYQPNLVYLVAAGGRMYCAVIFSTSAGAQNSVPLTLLPNTNYHVACVYDGQSLCIYANYTLASGTFSNGGDLQVGSIPTSPANRWTGTIDELKIYDHALNATELAQLYGAESANDAPSVIFEIGGTRYGSSFSTPASTKVSMTAIVQDYKQAYSGAPQPAGAAAGFPYNWQALTTTCGGVVVESPTTPTTEVDFNDIATSTLSLCVSDGEIAQEATQSVSATASVPQVVTQPSEGDIDVPENAVNFPISVEGTSLPPPQYSWQMLVITTVNSSTGFNGTTRDYYEHDSVVPLDVLLGFRSLDERDVVEVEEFQSIPGATYSTLLLNGSLLWDGVVIRCLVYNAGGSVPTNNFTIHITSPLTPGASGSSSDAALIGGIVGGVGGGLLLLCLLLLLLVALVMISRRRRSAYRQLKQPDYDAVAFGDVKEDVYLPKKQIEEYRELEQLIAAPDHRLALAICGVASMGEREVVYRSLLRVLAGQYQAYNFIARTISLEVNEADEEGTLFRSNSAAAKLFSLYMRVIGLKYLWHVLVLSVHSLNDNARDLDTNRSTRTGGGGRSHNSSKVFGHKYRMDRDDDDDEDSGSAGMDILGFSSMELDPQKLDEASDLDINTLELWLTAQKMLKFVMQSETAIPKELRMLIRRIHDEVKGKFSEDAVFRAMGGFFFLRLICPALLAPQLHGLLDDTPHPMAQRQLILVTKVLQNLANDTLPGAKEAYMERLNAFIVSNKPALQRFYDQIVEHPDHGKLTDTTVPQRARNDGLIKLRKFLEANLSAVETFLRDENDDADEVIDKLRRVLRKERPSDDQV